MTRNDQKIQDRIPSEYSEQISKQFSDLLSTENTRKRIVDVVCDYVNTVEFMKKVKEYAKEQIDSSVYQSFSFGFKTVILPIIVSLITILALKFFRVD